MKRHTVVFSVALLGLTGCVQTKQLRPYDAAQYGLAACSQEVMDNCLRIANRTFYTFGPRQIEYHDAGGRVWLWVGDRIVPGYWNVIKGLGAVSLCYTYAHTGTACQVMGNKGTPYKFVTFREGDYYALANRKTGPFDLGMFPWNAPFTAIEQHFDALNSNSGIQQ